MICSRLRRLPQHFASFLKVMHWTKFNERWVLKDSEKDRKWWFPRRNSSGDKVGPTNMASLCAGACFSTEAWASAECVSYAFRKDMASSSTLGTSSLLTRRIFEGDGAGGKAQAADLLTPKQADKLIQVVEQDLGIPSTSWKWALAIGIGPYMRFRGRKVK